MIFNTFCVEIRPNARFQAAKVVYYHVPNKKCGGANYIFI